jgi:hypothetical protein
MTTKKMELAPPGSPYAVFRRDDGSKVVEIWDLDLAEALAGPLHMCRVFPVVITCPSMEGKSTIPGRPGYLWIPAGEKDGLDRMMKDKRTGFEFVAFDLVNGVESAFYRNQGAALLNIDGVKRFCFTEANKSRKGGN